MKTYLTRDPDRPTAGTPTIKACDWEHAEQVAASRGLEVVGEHVLTGAWPDGVPDDWGRAKAQELANAMED